MTPVPNIKSPKCSHTSLDRTRAVSLTALLPALKYLATALAGGGIWKLLDWLLRRKAQDHDHDVQDAAVARELRDELRLDLDEMRQRIDSLEDSLDTEREARVKAELQNQVLLAKVDLLIRMVNDLRAEQGLEPIKEADILPVN